MDCDSRLEKGRKCINDFVYVWFCDVGALFWLGGNVLGCPEGIPSCGKR